MVNKRVYALDLTDSILGGVFVVLFIIDMVKHYHIEEQQQILRNNPYKKRKVKNQLRIT